MDSLLNGVVSNTAFASALGVIAFGVQRIGRSPQLAHALWLLVLIKLVTPPMFQIDLADRFGFSARHVSERGSPGNSDRLRRSAIADGKPPMTTHSPEPACRDGEPMPAADESMAGPAEMTALTTSPASPGASAISRLVTLLAGRWQYWLCAVWAGGVIVGVAILWRRLGQFHTLLIEAIDGDATLIDDVRALARRLGMRHDPTIRIIEAHVPPLVFAGWRSLILLIPARLLRELDREQLHAVLVHELAHIRRRDHLTRWFEMFIRGIFWWHPLTWWASRQLRRAEEECCDAWVVWALPDGRRSYGKALLWTIEFLAERRLFSVAAGTALGGSHVKRRIEMIMNQQLNRRMSWSALFALIVLSASVLPVAAQIRDNETPAAIQDRVNDSVPTSSNELAAGHPQGVSEKRDLEARIEQLERLVQELSQTIKRPADDSNEGGQIDRGTPANPRTMDAIELLVNGRFYAGVRGLETAEDRHLKETLLALDKQAWDAASRRDWKVYEKLLRPGYHWGYFGTSRNAQTVKSVQRRRYFDANIREVEVGKITEDVAFLKYVYDCKVEEAGQVQTYRDHQSMQIWTQINGDWLVTYTTNFLLRGGE